jgi:hypothetical protein
MAHSTAEIVEAYFEFKRTQDDALMWAWDAVDVDGFDDPVAKWHLILALLEAAPDALQIGLLAAGPLEDLIKVQGPKVIDLIEAEASRNPRLREALAGTWLRVGDAVNPIAERVEQLLARRLD